MWMVVVQSTSTPGGTAGRPGDCKELVAVSAPHDRLLLVGPLTLTHRFSSTVGPSRGGATSLKTPAGCSGDRTTNSPRDWLPNVIGSRSPQRRELPTAGVSNPPRGPAPLLIYTESMSSGAVPSRLSSSVCDGAFCPSGRVPAICCWIAVSVALRPARYCP